MMAWATLGLAKPIETCGIPSAAGSTDCTKSSAKGLFENSTVRCKVLDVRCSPEKDFKFRAEIEVEKWISGSGSKKIEAQFSEKLALGKGLSADLTLENRSGKWVVIAVANPTTSKAELPVCKFP